MQLVGDNLGTLRKQIPGSRFSLGTTLRLCIQCLDAIEAMHDSGLLHRDIKPANYAIGSTPKDNKTVYLLDFGLVRRFRQKNGNIRPPRPTAGFRGTPKYASVNVHNNVEQGRHDDLWSWLFMMIEFHKGELPWRLEADRQKIGELKESTKDDFLHHTPHEIPKMYKTITKLKYFDEPSYSDYRKTLNHMMKKRHVIKNDRFDWEEDSMSTKSISRAESTHSRKKHKRKAVKKDTKDVEKDKSETEISDSGV